MAYTLIDEQKKRYSLLDENQQSDQKPSVLVAIPTGMASIIPQMAGMPIDTATNIANLGISGYGIAKKALSTLPKINESDIESLQRRERDDYSSLSLEDKKRLVTMRRLGEISKINKPEPLNLPEPIEPSSQIGGSDYLKSTISDLLGADVFSNPRPDSRLATALHTGSNILAGGMLSPANTMTRTLTQMIPSAIGGGTAQYLMPDNPYAATIGSLAGPLVVSGVSNLHRMVQKPSYNEAQTKVMKALGRDKIPIEQAVDEMEKLGQGSMLADVGGENVRDLARSTANLPGPGKQIAASSLNARQSGQSARVNEQIGKSLGAGDLFHKNIDDLLNIRKIESSKFYDKAIKAENLIPKDKFTPIAKDEFLQSVIKKVKSDPLYNISGMSDRSMPVMDQAKKYIDRMINSAKRGNNPNNYEISNLVEKSNKIKDISDNSFIDYKIARDRFAGPTKLIDALEEGKKFLKGDAEITAKALSNMTKSEADFFRIGVARELRDRVLNTPDTANSVRKLINTPLIRDKLKTVFPSSDEFERFSRALEKEAKFYETRSQMFSGSRTAPLEKQMTDTLENGLDNLKIGAAVSRGDILGAAHGLVRKMRAPSSLKPETSEMLARVLFESQTPKSVLESMSPSIRKVPYQVPRAALPISALLANEYFNERYGKPRL